MNKHAGFFLLETFIAKQYRHSFVLLGTKNNRTKLFTNWISINLHNNYVLLRTLSIDYCNHSNDATKS